VGLQGKRRSVILHWVQREYRNLLKAREAGVRVPKPIAIKNYILVMEFIGKGDEIAPALKDKQPEDISGFFKDIVLNMKKLYKAGLVHADLSAFNILNLDDKPVFIDFSQTSSLQDSRAQEYLSRDVRNVCMYFRKIGLKVNEEDVLKEIKSK
jgi:RIO kinase 1